MFFAVSYWKAPRGILVKYVCMYVYCFQSSERFQKLYMYIQSKTFIYEMTSHKISRIQVQRSNYKWSFEPKNTLIVYTGDQKFNCNNADGHSQTGNQQKNQQV